MIGVSTPSAMQIFPNVRAWTICQCTALQSVPTGQGHVAAGFNLRSFVRRDISPNGTTAIRKRSRRRPVRGLDSLMARFLGLKPKAICPDPFRIKPAALESTL